ncbi:hypothetical protein OE810_06435 [Rhodobacteraceae bacterium XHP0102]|nr:hypothetical protein [Rhodobacteraceae bacterium XHP0102]
MAEKKSTTAQAGASKRQKTTKAADAKPAVRKTASASRAAASETQVTPQASPDPNPTPNAPSASAAARNPMWPMVLGGGLAAALGFGAASLLPQTAVMPASDISSDVNVELAALSAAQDDLAATQQAEITQTRAALAMVEERLAAISADLDDQVLPEVDLSPLTTQIASLEQELEQGIAAQAAALSAIEARLDLLEARPEGLDVSLLGEDGIALDQRIATLQAMVESQAAMLEGISADATTALDDLRQAIASERGMIEASSALLRLSLAMDSGEPFAAALDDAESGSGIAAPAALRAAADQGLPRLSELSRAFAPLAREALPVALRETAGETFSARAGAFLQGQIGGRSLAPREGDDPDAVLSRIQGAIDQDNLPLALQELDQLPASAQAVFAQWVAAVNSRLSAMAAYEEYRAAIGRAD